MSENYSAKIVKVYGKDLTTKDRIAVKNTSDAIKLDRETQENGAVAISVDYFAELAIHSEKADPQDYSQYVIVDKDGTKYVTGSPSFWSTFMDIYDEVQDAEDIDDFAIKVYRMPSRNREGKDFLTCTII